MREYRLVRKKKGDLYYPQVREDKVHFEIFGIGFFPYMTNWKRIGVHHDGFGLYPCDNFRYGVGLIEAEQILMDYEEQFMDEEPPNVFCYESQASVRFKIEIRNNPKPKYQHNALDKK
jgi:hypothetical protein